MEKLEIQLKRVFKGDTYTIGKMSIDGVYFCDTLEDKNRDLNENGKFDNGEEKVYGETCIPFGRYKIKLAYIAKFKRETPWLQNVPNFSGILIHAGNVPAHTLGCILVGENKVKGMVINSKPYELKLTKQIKEAIAQGKEVYITIT